jgi:hypothetical protein
MSPLRRLLGERGLDLIGTPTCAGGNWLHPLQDNKSRGGGGQRPDDCFDRTQFKCSIMQTLYKF